MFTCERNNIGCASISSNWVEFECFSDRTRCIWNDEALEGGEWKRGRSNRDERKFKKCLFAFSGVAFEEEIKLLLRCCSSSKLLYDKCITGVTFAFKLIF